MALVFALPLWRPSAMLTTIFKTLTRPLPIKIPQISVPAWVGTLQLLLFAIACAIGFLDFGSKARDAFSTHTFPVDLHYLGRALILFSLLILAVHRLMFD